ncbi:hypothetical protein AB4254_08745 [Vibrio breoganii]
MNKQQINLLWMLTLITSFLLGTVAIYNITLPLARELGDSYVLALAQLPLMLAVAHTLMFFEIDQNKIKASFPKAWKMIRKVSICIGCTTLLFALWIIPNTAIAFDAIEHGQLIARGSATIGALISTALLGIEATRLKRKL